jgi:hypothetical protein
LLEFCGDGRSEGFLEEGKDRAQRTTYASAPKSHHLREPVEANAHKESQRLKRTDFGGPRQCMEEKGNVSAIEWTVGGN